MPRNATPNPVSNEFRDQTQSENTGVLTDNIMRRDPHQNLMQYRRQKEDRNARPRRAPPPRDKRREDVALKVPINRLVPRPPVHPQILAIPPVVVERPVPEARNLRQRVERRLEEGKEAREPDDERDGRQLEEALEDGGVLERVDLDERVEEQGGGVLRRDEPDEDAEEERLADALGDKGPADFGGPRVHGLVEERRGPPEVDEVPHGDVARVGALGVEVRYGGEGARVRVEVRVAEVAVREGVRVRLEEHDDDVQLGYGADERVVDVVVDDIGRVDERGDDVESVQPGDGDPGAAELGSLLGGGPVGAAAALAAEAGGLRGGDGLDDVGEEEVARDEEVEGEPEEDVLLAEVVAADADEDAVLGKSAGCGQGEAGAQTFSMFSIMRRMLPATARG